MLDAELKWPGRLNELVIVMALMWCVSLVRVLRGPLFVYSDKLSGRWHDHFLKLTPRKSRASSITSQYLPFIEFTTVRATIKGICWLHGLSSSIICTSLCTSLPILHILPKAMILHRADSHTCISTYQWGRIAWFPRTKFLSTAGCFSPRFTKLPIVVKSTQLYSKILFRGPPLIWKHGVGP